MTETDSYGGACSHLEGAVFGALYAYRGTLEAQGLPPIAVATTIANFLARLAREVMAAEAP